MGMYAPDWDLERFIFSQEVKMLSKSWPASMGTVISFVP